jgi:mRNA-degrading endonuclease RelE of RelBE toxin-antitoxin system
VSYKVELTANFQKEFRPLVKKYRSLKDDLAGLITELEENPEIGTPLGHNCYKIRLGIKSKGRGKSTGGRVITRVFVAGRVVFLLSIYDKSDRSTVTDAQLLELLKSLP